MTSNLNRKIQAAVLSTAMVLTAGSVFADQWTKPQSRTRGTAIGAAAGAILGPPGMIAGAAIGNGVQSMRHHVAPQAYGRRHISHHRHFRHFWRHHRHHRS